ncbi:MAG: S41 family peptidase [Bacteroidales bacterium]|nr:S41 family peptidase [Bacteroidales bacterium]MDD4670949.1 S41 family peptidase [Bacteroidales bacterium]
MKYLKVSLVLLALISSLQLNAQSNSFKLGQSLEVQNAILKEISNSYVDTVKYDKMLTTGIQSMLGSLDPYTTYIPEEDEENLELLTTGIYGGVGATIKKRPSEAVLIVQPYSGSPASKAGLVPGDQIIEIDGASVIGLSSEESSNKMKGQPGTQVKFKVVKGRTGDTVDVVVTRERIHISDIEYAGIIKDSIGYIKLTGFTDKMSVEMKEKVLSLKQDGAKRIILDLRGNGGGIMDEAIQLVSLFVPKGTLVVSSKGRNPIMNQEYFTTDTPIDTLIPLMVMVNSGSASSSEIVAGALQDLDRAVIAGKRTFGKGLIQSIKPVPYNGKVKITTGKYYTPSGRCVQAIDYSHRNEDGSVGNVPDSLKKEFKTKNGRSVYDGGGITPDIETKSDYYSRPAVSLVYSDVLGDYATEYFKNHPAIASPADFYLTDAEYADFVKYASTRDFDYRSGAETVLEQLVKAARQDNLYDEYKAEIEALESRIKMDKETMLNVKKDEIKALLEQEIVIKYYFASAGTIVMLRDDPQLYDAIDLWLK